MTGTEAFIHDVITQAERTRRRQRYVGALDGEYHEVEPVAVRRGAICTYACPNCRREYEVVGGRRFECICGDLLIPAGREPP